MPPAWQRYHNYEENDGATVAAGGPSTKIRRFVKRYEDLEEP